MKIEKNKVVSLSYELEVDGQIADKADASRPLQYIHGAGMLLPRFEEEVAGKEPGETFKFTLSAQEGYGEYNPAYKFEIPKTSFADQDGKVRNDLLQVGNIIPMMNTAGQVVQGKIAAIGEESVTMDFNHPMAGKTLNFSGSVVEVREATEKELKEGLQHHCGGGCHGGDCGGDCSCDGDCACGSDCSK